MVSFFFALVQMLHIPRTVDQVLTGDLFNAAAAAAAKSLHSCPTLCDPRDGSPPVSPIPGILQARTLEWGAIALSMYACSTF